LPPHQLTLFAKFVFHHPLLPWDQGDAKGVDATRKAGPAIAFWWRSSWATAQRMWAPKGTSAAGAQFDELQDHTL